MPGAESKLLLSLLHKKNNWIMLTKIKRRHSSPPNPPPREVYKGCGRIEASIKIIIIDA
jgi:hypothetical protein